MHLEVKRDFFTPKSTGGKLFIDGVFVGYTLEPPKLPVPAKPRAIDCGTFKLVVAWSPKHGRDLPLVVNVPDFTGVEIHIGNWPHDTLGCLLVGESRGPDFVAQSTAEFGQVFDRINAAFKASDPIDITYSEENA